MAHPTLFMILLGGCFLLPETLAATKSLTSLARRPSTDKDVLLATRLWEEVCKNPKRVSFTGKDGDNDVYCAYFTNLYDVTVTHKPIELSNTKSSKGEQYIVIDPPWYRYKHKVKLTGNRTSGPQTTIFVRPPKNSHTVELEDDTTPTGGAKKPKILYLKPEVEQSSDGSPVTTEASDTDPDPDEDSLPSPRKGKSFFDRIFKRGRDSNKSSSSSSEEDTANAEAESAPLPLVAEGTGISQQVSVRGAESAPVDNDNARPDAQSRSGDEFQAAFTPGVFRLGSGTSMQYTV